MKALTVQQPWAWTMIHGGKSPENRSRNIAGSYRGPVAIHAGLRWSDQGAAHPLVEDAVWDHYGTRAPLANHHVWPAEWNLGAFIGVVDLVSVHHDSDHGRGYPCSPWAMVDDWHLVVADPRPLPVPIPCKGRLGLWTPPAEVLHQLQAVTR